MVDKGRECHLHFKNWGAWVAQTVERLTLAQVMSSRFVGLNPVSGSVPTARSLEPASDPVSPSPSAPPLLVYSAFLSLSQKSTLKKVF